VELSGAEIISAFLEDEGIEHIFGYPGGAVLHIYDALFRRNKVEHILVRHEQAALHAADGYARATGKTGVALVTSGPGMTNAVTGIATAHLDSIPLVVISGQVPTSMIGSDAFQEVDSVGISRPCVKHNFLVKDINDLALTLKKAFYIASSGRPGPVLIDIPKDICDPNIKIPYTYPHNIQMRSYNPVIKGHSRQVKKAIALILGAKKPVVYSGGGVVLSNASKSLTQLVKQLNLPITNTLMGLGSYPGTDEKFLGMLGMHGTYEANMAMHDTDVLIAIGVRFDDRVTGKLEEFCPDAKIIHIDIDPSSISKNVKVDIPIVGDVNDVILDMLNILKEMNVNNSDASYADWWKQINQWRKKNCLKYKQTKDSIAPQYVVESLYKETQGDALITSDVGQHQMFAAQYYKFNRPRQWINSGGLGTMGFGLPAAMGVQMAYPEQTVACITGEGSIQMNIQELATCMQYGLPIKIINLNNRFLGMVRQWQEFFYEGRYAMSYMDSLPDFVKLAESYGHVGMQITKPGDVEGALKEAFAMKDKLVFMDFITEREANVYPMISAGKGHHEMELAPDSELL
jgi:acetolactate synthase I/II/III large subunit